MDGSIGEARATLDQASRADWPHGSHGRHLTISLRLGASQVQRFVCTPGIFSLVFGWPVCPHRFCCCQEAPAAALEGSGSVFGLCVGTSSLWMMGFECWSASLQISNCSFFSNSAAHCQRLRCQSCLRGINTTTSGLTGCVYFDSGYLRCACFSADVATMRHANDPCRTRFVSAACKCV